MGGNAFEGKTARILKEHIKPTLMHLADVTREAGLNYNYLVEHILGSAGKNHTSGDIDLNIDQTKFDFDKISKLLIKHYGEENVKPRPGNNQIFTCVPVYDIDNEPTDENVQIDFMFGDVKWQHFSYYSPRTTNGHYRYEEDTSRFKGLFRTELLKALIAFQSVWVLEEDGEMVARVGPTFFHDRGILFRYRYRPFKRGSTTERVKALKEVSKDEFLKEFPSALTTDMERIIDPGEVVKFIGLETYAGYQPYEEQTWHTSYESIWRLVTWAHSPENRKIISKIFVERLNSLKVTIPDELKRAHSVPRTPKS